MLQGDFEKSFIIVQAHHNKDRDRKEHFWLEEVREDITENVVFEQGLKMT